MTIMVHSMGHEECGKQVCFYGAVTKFVSTIMESATIKGRTTVDRAIYQRTLTPSKLTKLFPIWLPDESRIAYRNRPFPDPERPVRVSTASGGASQWRGDDWDLFYPTLKSTLSSVDLQLGETIVSSAKKPMLQVSRNPTGGIIRYIVTPDDERFSTGPPPRRIPLEIVLARTQLLIEPGEEPR